MIALRVDVTDRDAMARAADETERAFGKVHVVCNNAGVGVTGPMEKMSYADWDWVVGVNLHGVINGVQTFARRIMTHGEGGHFVNTSSLAGQVAVPGFSVYNTTKFAVVGLSETMRAEFATHDIFGGGRTPLLSRWTSKRTANSSNARSTPPSSAT